MFPRPMPVRHDAKLFPRLFSTNSSWDVPYLPLDVGIASINENRSFALSGSPYFLKVRNISENSKCVQMYNQIAAWFDLPEDSYGPCHSANASWISGWWPAKHGEEQAPRQPKYAPHCLGINWGKFWPWP